MLYMYANQTGNSSAVLIGCVVGIPQPKEFHGGGRCFVPVSNALIWMDFSKQNGM